MLAFSRRQRLSPRPVDLNSLIGDMSDLLQRTLGGTVQVATAPAAKLWPALVDPTQIELVILNLAINARDAMASGGTVRISTRNVTASELRREAALPTGDYVCVAVCDDGEGMPPAVLERACEPFFTTKEPGKGSGLGLSQAYGVARQSGGDIVIDSEVGKGTTVEIYLPRSRVKSLARAPHQQSTEAATDHRGVTILVVDDQPDVRDVAVAHLEALGYHVVYAENGGAALEAIRDCGAIDLLIADFAMAEMNGVELARAARERRPDLPVVIMTGYTDIGAIDPQIPDALVLKKPCRLSELAETVKQALRRNDGAATAQPTL
jgi:CheY-like chemotaxis protein